MPVEPGELFERVAGVLRHDRHAAVDARRHVDQRACVRVALLHAREAARVGAALAQRRGGAREVIDRARHLSHLPTLAGDQLALVTELRVEPSHLVVQRSDVQLLLDSNGHGEDHERGDEVPTPGRARDAT